MSKYRNNLPKLKFAQSCFINHIIHTLNHLVEMDEGIEEDIMLKLQDILEYEIDKWIY